MPMTAQRSRHVNSHFAPALTLLLVCAAILLTAPPLAPAATVVGNSRDVTGTPYAGPVNSIQFKPVAAVQSIGTNTYWETMAYALATNGGAFSVSLQCGWYDASPVSTSIFGSATRPRRLFVPDDGTNVWQFNDCVSLASTQAILYTNAAGNISIVTTNTATVNLHGSGTVADPLYATAAANTNALTADQQRVLNTAPTNVVNGTSNSLVNQTLTIATNYGTGSGSQTPWTSTINANGNSLTNIPSITFGDDHSCDQ